MELMASQILIRRWSNTIAVLLISALVVSSGCVSKPSLSTERQVTLRSVKVSRFEIAGSTNLDVTLTIRNEWDRAVTVTFEDIWIEATKQDGTSETIPARTDHPSVTIPGGGAATVTIRCDNVPFQYVYDPKTGKLVPKINLKAYASYTAGFYVWGKFRTISGTKEETVSQPLPLKQDQLTQTIKQFIK